MQLLGIRMLTVVRWRQAYLFRAIITRSKRTMNLRVGAQPRYNA